MPSSGPDSIRCVRRRSVSTVRERITRRAPRAARRPRRAARPARARAGRAGRRRAAAAAGARGGRRRGGRGLLLGLVAEQVPVAVLALAGPAVVARDQLALHQAVDDGVQRRRVGEAVQALGALEQLARGLRPAQHHHGQHRLLLGPDLQRLVEQVAELGRAAAVVAGQPREAPAAEAVERVADRLLVVGDHRLAVGALVAGRAQRVQGQRIGVGRRALLLEQAARGRAALRGSGHARRAAYARCGWHAVHGGEGSIRVALARGDGAAASSSSGAARSWRRSTPRWTACAARAPAGW